MQKFIPHALLFLWLSVGLCAAAFAQAPVATYVVAADPRSHPEAVAHCLHAFTWELMGAGVVRRENIPVETQLNECLAELPGSASAPACYDETARGVVSYVFVMNARNDGDDWHFSVQSWTPSSEAILWQADDITWASSAMRAANDVCTRLASDFLLNHAYRSDVAEEGSGEAVSGPSNWDDDRAFVYIMTATPSLSQVYIGGEAVAVIPGEFEVPAGEPTLIEIRAPGYETVERTVTVPAGTRQVLRAVALDILPGTLRVTSNLEGAEILVDGDVVGTTTHAAPVDVTAPSGERLVEVRMLGFWSFETSIELAPGSTRSVNAILQASSLGSDQALELNPDPASAAETEQDDETAVMPIIPAGHDGPPLVPEYVLIAPGESLTLLSETDSAAEGEDSEPQTAVAHAFYLQTTEVTQSQWEALMGTQPSYHTECGVNCPVEQVSWLDAAAYANEMSRSEGLMECYDDRGRIIPDRGIVACEGYRLPTEAEWQYAAQAGSTDGKSTPLSAFAWHQDNSGGQSRPVGQLQHNGHGLYDMLGNVWEWTQDPYDPEDARRELNGREPDLTMGRSMRGGSWQSAASANRSASRGFGASGTMRSDVGFRLARTAPP